MTWEEINEAIKAKVDEATADKEGDEATKAKADVLKNMTHSVRQFIHDGGHKQATAQLNDKFEDLKSEKQALQTKIDQAESRIAEMEEEVPDADAIKEQYQQEVADLKKQHKETVEQLKGTVRDLKVGGVEGKILGRVGPKLSEEGEDWARTQVTMMKQQGRIRATDDGYEVLQPGKEIPYTADGEDELLSVVSDELLGKARSWALKSNGDKGGGSSSQNGSAAGGYDPAKEGKEMAQKQKGGGDNTLAFQ